VTARARGESVASPGDERGAEHEPHQFGTEDPRRLRGDETEGARNVAEETGSAEPHVGRVPEQHDERGGHADQRREEPPASRTRDVVVVAQKHAGIVPVPPT